MRILAKIRLGRSLTERCEVTKIKIIGTEFLRLDMVESVHVRLDIVESAHVRRVLYGLYQT